MMMRYWPLLLLGCSASPTSSPSSPAPAPPAAGPRFSCAVEAEGGDPAAAETPGAALDVRRSGTKVTVLPKAALAAARDLEAFLRAADDYLTRSRSGPRIYRLTTAGSPVAAAQAFRALGIRGVTATVSDAGGQTTARRLESPDELSKIRGVTSAYGAAPPTQLTYYAPRGGTPQLVLISRTDAALLTLASLLR